MADLTSLGTGPTSVPPSNVVLSNADALRISMKKKPSAAELSAALSKAVHNINNPLSVISGHAQLLLEISETEALDPEIATYLQNIEEASRRLVVELDRLSDLGNGIGPFEAGGDGV